MSSDFKEIIYSQAFSFFAYCMLTMNIREKEDERSEDNDECNDDLSLIDQYLRA